MRRTDARPLTVLLVLALCAPALTPVRAADVPPEPNDPAAIEFFEKKVRPILADNCFTCHSDNAKKLKGKLKLDSRERILKGGESETPAAVPGKPEESLMIKAVHWKDEDLAMPPKKKLKDEQIAALEEWIKAGMAYPSSGNSTTQSTSQPATQASAMTVEDGRSFWSFVPPKEQAVPQQPDVTLSSWAKTDVDRFVLAKLIEKNLKPSPMADKRTLIRRATFDLTGLPPTSEEVAAFEADGSTDAFDKVVDRLLASPHYGERWGRHWLDVARYADTKGYLFEEERRYPFSYTYRDWVIRAFNEDLPYDQFLIQQIAADRLDLKDDKRPLAALGFLTLGRRFLNNQHDIIDDRIDVVTRGTMGLTVSCARCHDHKFDPIPTADYYSLYGVFASSQEPAELPLIGGTPPEKLAEYGAELAKRKAELETYTKTRHGELVAELRKPEQIAKYLIEAQKKITPEPISPEFEVPDDAKGVNPWVTRRWEARLKAAADGNDAVFALWRHYASIPADQFEAATTQPTTKPVGNPIIAKAIFDGGAPKSLQDVANRYGAALAAADGADVHPDPEKEALRLILRAPDAPTTVALEETKFLLGNVDRMKRRALKQKIDELVATHPGSPERAMAMEDLPMPVTPKIFKRGNPSNIGDEVPRQFLAVLSPEKREPFKHGSGRLDLAKAIASKDNPLTARVMVNRVWLHHFGQGLVRTPSDFGTRGERPTHPELFDYLARRFMDDNWSVKKLHKLIMLSSVYRQSSDDHPQAREIDPENRWLARQNRRRLDFEAMRDSLLAAAGELDRKAGGRPVDIVAEPFARRRSVYGFIDRQNLPGMFRTFDFASPDATSAQRFATSVPQQALFMMNSPFVLAQAKKLATREDVKAAAEPRKRIEKLYTLVYARPPAQPEIDAALKFIGAEAATPPEVAKVPESQWHYGYGPYDAALEKLAAFKPMPHFAEKKWSGGPVAPDPKIGWAMLVAHGGHPGDGNHAVVRRWVAPRDGIVSVNGKLSHNATEGDGVRGHVITPEGELGSWTVHKKEAATQIDGIAIKKGQTIDFVVDCRAGVEHDAFAWPVTVKMSAIASAAGGDDGGGEWDAQKQFAGPPGKPPAPLDPWEKYAQVLLETNEFVFVD